MREGGMGGREKYITKYKVCGNTEHYNIIDTALEEKLNII